MPSRKKGAATHPLEARKAELEMKMRASGLVSSELGELQEIRKSIDDAAAEEERRKQATRDQFRKDILQEKREAAERLVRLPQGAQPDDGAARAARHGRHVLVAGVR